MAVKEKVSTSTNRPRIKAIIKFLLMKWAGHDHNYTKMMLSMYLILRKSDGKYASITTRKMTEKTNFINS